MEHTDTQTLFTAFDSLRRAHASARKARPYCDAYDAVLYWGGAWLTLAQGARALTALSGELRRRTGWGPPFWSTVVEHGQSSFYFMGSQPVRVGSPYKGAA